MEIPDADEGAVAQVWPWDVLGASVSDTVGIDHGKGKAFTFGLISIAYGNEERVGSGGRKLDRDTAFGGRPARHLTSDQLFFGTGNGHLRGVDRVVDGFAPPLIFIEET